VAENSILLIGAGGHARACIDVIEQDGRFSVFGLTGLSAEIGQNVLGYPVLGTDVDLPQFLIEAPNALITVGQIKSAELRKRLYRDLLAAGFAMPAIVSPRGYVSPHAEVGNGTIVMHGAVVNAGAKVGANCILNSQSLVEHDAIVGDHCHISTGAAINSGVHVGAETFIGSNCSVRQGLRIGARCLIGMGQRILSDCEDGVQIPRRIGTN
jgi:sugar O-acyltransferase (sialic acid O-acetyltransferase NeuD family)